MASQAWADPWGWSSAGRTWSLLLRPLPSAGGLRHCRQGTLPRPLGTTQLPHPHSSPKRGEGLTSPTIMEGLADVAVTIKCIGI